MERRDRDGPGPRVDPALLALTLGSFYKCANKFSSVLLYWLQLFKEFSGIIFHVTSPSPQQQLVSNNSIQFNSNPNYLE